MNVFKEMGLSIYSYGSYSQFLKNRKGKVFGFGVLLVTIYYLVVYLIPVMINMVSPYGLVQGLRENVPDFELRDGTLWVEEVVEIDRSGTYILIDTDPYYVFYGADEMEEYFRGYPQFLLMDSEKMIVKSNGEVDELYFSDLDLDFSREDLAEFIPWLYVIYFVIMFFAYFWIVGLFFFGVLFVALIGMIAASAMKCPLTFGQLYLLGIYSRTLPLLIKALVSFLPFGIPMFWVINFGLSVFIIIMAMRKMKEQEADIGLKL